MRYHFGVVSCLLLASGCMAEMMSNAYYYCADINPQPHIMIDELMGIWYGIEVIIHSDDLRYQPQKLASCPTIHIREDRSLQATSKNYNYNYSPQHTQYGYGTNNRQQSQNYDPNRRGDYVQSSQYPTDYDRQRDYERQRDHDRTRGYEATTGYGGNYPRRYGGSHDDYVGHHLNKIRYLRLFWDENGSSTEFRLNFNSSQPGFWKSSGPVETGTALAENRFAGTVQVIKAVGDHLVLTFCHQQPERQLYSVILSREKNLEENVIHGVHSLFYRKGLSTSSIRRVCNGASANNFNLFIGLGLFIISYVFERLR